MRASLTEGFSCLFCTTVFDDLFCKLQLSPLKLLVAISSEVKTIAIRLVTKKDNPLDLSISLIFDL